MSKKLNLTAIAQHVAYDAGFKNLVGIETRLGRTELRDMGGRFFQKFFRADGSPTMRPPAGFLDLIVMNDAGGLLGIQSTSRGNVSARAKKIEAHPNFRRAVCFMSVVVWGFDPIPNPDKSYTFRELAWCNVSDTWADKIRTYRPTRQQGELL